MQADGTRRPKRQVDDPPTDKWTAVIYSDDYCFPGTYVDNPHLGAERQGSVCSSKPLRVEFLPIRRNFAAAIV